jgi:16S rRNA (cytidine1402-2'-O)-methyltransferase
VTGELVVVSTPIGNLGDLSPRAAATLSQADIVCAEDTRHTGLALKRLGIDARRLLSLHAHNERDRIPGLISELLAGARVALVSDAGTPSVSDPGDALVAAAIDAGVRVTAVPGPSAVLAAVAVAGMGGERWAFEGFLPRKGRERRERLSLIARAPAPSVMFESPRRVVATLADLEEVCGPGRTVAVCRELTKLHEEVRRSSLAEAVEHFSTTEPRGEFVLVIAGRPSAEAAAERPAPDELRLEVESLVAAGSTRRDAIAEVAERSGVPKRQVYDAAVRPLSTGEAPAGR